MDFLTRHRNQRIGLVVIFVTIMILSVLPESIAQRFSLHREYLLGILGILVLLGLFLWAKFSLLLVTMLLVMGANLPDRWALGLDIERAPLYGALAFMIFGALLNRWTNLLPTGIEPPARKHNPEGFKALTNAIMRRQARSIDIILKMNVAVDFIDDNGMSPLMLAASTGQEDVVDKLLAAGANVDLANPAGKTAGDFARAAGHKALARLLDPAGDPVATVPATRNASA